MKAYELQTFGQPLRLTDRPEPQPAGTEVVIAVTDCGVCHTDLHLREGYYEAGDGRKLTLASRGIHPPMVLGHEIVGTLIAVGPEAPIDPALLGDSFIVYPWIGCGTCPTCDSGLDNLCENGRALGVQRPGGYQERVLVPHPRYLFDANGLDRMVAATCACSGLTAYAALCKLPLAARDAGLVLVGAGGVGLNALSLARALGHRRIAVADVNPARRSDALGMGANIFVDPLDPDARAVVSQALGPVGSVIDFVGSTQTAQWATSLLRKGGSYVVVGLFGGELTMSLAALIMRAQSVIGSYVGSPSELGELLNLVRRSEMPLLRTERVPWPALNEALDRLAAGAVAGRLVIGIR